MGEPCLICCNVPNAIGGATEFSASHGVLIDSTQLLAKMRFYFQKNEVFFVSNLSISAFKHSPAELFRAISHPPTRHTHTHTHTRAK